MVEYSRERLKELQGKLEREEGTAAEAQVWLDEFAEIAQQIWPGFYYSDAMDSMRHRVRQRFATEALAGEYGSPLTRDQLIDMAREIRAGLEHRTDFDQYDALCDLFDKSVPRPQASYFVLTADTSMSIDEIVDTVLAFKAIQLPGPIG